MTLFGSLFGPTNPTKDWPSAGNLGLDFDLESGTLNGIGLREPLAKLSFLGPVEERSGLMLRAGEFRYYSHGLAIQCDVPPYTIDDFELVQHDPDSLRYVPYAGICRYRVKSLHLGRITERSFQHDFGSPYWRNEDGEEVILFYEFQNLEWQVEFSVEGALIRIVVTANPIMADERQREAYGVTEPWPSRP
jgi:hypothetical protein